MKKYIPILIALSTMSSMSYAASPREDAVDYLQMRKGVAYQVTIQNPLLVNLKRSSITAKSRPKLNLPMA